MDKLEYNKTESTPGVQMNHLSHFIEFQGDSRPENVKGFYEPIMNWLNDYSNYLYFIVNNSSCIKITTNFKFEYFNSSSAKYVLEILRHLSKMNDEINGVEIEVNWYYEEEDEDMRDAGIELEKVVNVQMNITEYNN